MLQRYCILVLFLASSHPLINSKPLADSGIKFPAEDDSINDVTRSTSSSSNTTKVSEALDMLSAEKLAPQTNQTPMANTSPIVSSTQDSSAAAPEPEPQSSIATSTSENPPKAGLSSDQPKTSEFPPILVCRMNVPKLEPDTIPMVGEEKVRHTRTSMGKEAISDASSGMMADPIVSGLVKEASSVPSPKQTVSVPETVPTIVSSPEPEAKSKAVPEPVAEVQPKAEPEPAAEVQPKAEPEPVAEVQPKAVPEPVAEVQPKAEPEPAAEVQPKSEPEPVAEVKPKAESEPQSKAEVTPANTAAESAKTSGTSK